MWSVRELDRNISTQYFERRLAAQLTPNVEDLPAIADKEPLEYIKNLMVAEFMGFRKDAVYSESDMEQALINNLEKFILELGRGFAFVERQQHIVTETSDLYIDLVFYNFKMKRFVIFELKTHRLTHQDIGQLDMYVRMYDDLVKGADDNPPLVYCYVQTQIIPLHVILYYMIANRFLQPNTCLICLQKKSYAKK